MDLLGCQSCRELVTVIMVTLMSADDISLVLHIAMLIKGTPSTQTIIVSIYINYDVI